jgi:hypothetical protein
MTSERGHFSDTFLQTAVPVVLDFVVSTELLYTCDTSRFFWHAQAVAVPVGSSS